MKRYNRQQKWVHAAFSIGIVMGGATHWAEAVDIVIGPFFKLGQYPTMPLAAAAAHLVPPGVAVTIVVTPGFPWPGLGVFYRPVTIRSLVPDVQAILTGAMTFNGGSEGSVIDQIDFQLLTSVSSPRITTYVDLTVRDTDFSGLPGSSSGDLGGAMHINGNVSIDDCVFHDFHCDTAGGGIQIVGGVVTVSDSVFTSCNAGEGGAISVDGDSSLAVDDCTFMSCEATKGNGGGIRCSGNALSVLGSNLFVSCTAVHGGGLWANTSGAAVLDQCIVTDCTSSLDGGGFWVGSASGGHVTECVFSGNSAGRNGGALYAAGPLTVSGTGSIMNGLAGGKGGAVCLADGATLHGYNFYTNKAGGSGGAVHLSGSDCTINGGGTMVLESNESEGIGGAISTSGNGHRISGVQCRYNTADAGGAISIGAGDVTVVSSVCEENEGGLGGGIFASGAGGLVIEDLTLSRNTASIGGGLWAASRDIDIRNVLIERNIAGGAGGAYLKSCTGTMADTTIRLHDVAGAAGGVMLFDSNVSLNACNVQLNTSGLSGGGVFAEGGSLVLMQGNYEYNVALEAGGGIFASVDSITVDTASVLGNFAFLGGGLYQYGGQSHFVDATVVENVGQFGGGAYCDSGDVLLERTLVRSNEAQEDGGGVLASFCGNVVCDDSTFHENIAERRGGGVCLLDSAGSFVDTDVLGNVGVSAGGGVFGVQSTLAMNRCVVAGNWSEYGGGMSVYGGGWVTLLQSSVSSNYAEDEAAGIALGPETLLTADRVQFFDNHLSATSAGTSTALFGGQKLLITNSLMANNGSAAVIATTGYLGLCSSTVTHNGGGIRCTGTTPSSIANSIVWANSGVGGVGADIVYSCIEGGAAGPGNIDVDPMFVAPSARNYTLQADSPCINAGKISLLMQDLLDVDGDGDVSEFTPFDLPGNPRVMGGQVDMGAFEFVLDDPSCDGDLNGDGIVDITDLLALIGAWGTPAGDLNGDGITDISDLLVVLEFFGPC